MTLGRTYLVCALLGAAALGACSDTSNGGGGLGGTQTSDSGVGVAPIPGGAAGGAQPGGTQAGVGGAQAGVGGALAGAGGTQSGLGGTQAGAGGTVAGGTPSGTGGAAGGTHGGTASGTGGTTGGPAGTGGMTGATGGHTGSTGGTTAGPGGNTSGTGGPGGPGTCDSFAPVTDYNAKGPYADAKRFDGVGPDGNYTFFRPDTSLGKDGMKHPIAIWGDGILMVPGEYNELLLHIASHGFVILACNDIMAEFPCLNAGMDWLVMQNTTAGPLQGKLDTSREISIGYSWGGGAAIDTSVRPNIKATVSFHGMPPRQDPWAKAHAPLILFTSTGDTFVSSDGYVMPNYNSSMVPTFYTQLQEDVGHLYIADEGADSCVAAAALGGPCSGAVKERGPAVAWLRYFVCNDQGAKKFFFGADATMCKSPFVCQKKPANMWQ